MGASGERALRLVLGATGAVMVVAGSATVLLGAASLVGVGDFTAVADSEMRFYAVWYVVAGLLLLRAIQDVRAGAWTIRLIASAFGVAGGARALSWGVAGRPHVSQIVLMVIELVLPLVVLPWHARVIRPTGSS